MNKKAWNWVGGIAAAALMGTSLVYYNFIDKPDVSNVVMGEEAPNFIAKVYKNKGDEFYLSDEIITVVSQRGKVVVINFWETYCVPCIKELPDFDKIQKEYVEDVKVIAVVGNASTPDGAAEWMTNKSWKAHDSVNDWTDFSLTFAYLSPNVCTSYGCSGPLPRTVVIDQEGTVVYEKNASMHYDDLKALLTPLL